MAQTIPSSNDLAVMFEAALRLGIDPAGTGAVNLRAGSDNAVLVSMATQLGNRVFGYVADRVRARSFASSTGDDLDEFVEDIFADKRKDPSQSTSTVYLRRTGTAATTINKGTHFGVRAQGTQRALQFEATADTPAGNGVLTVAVPVKCLTLGTVGNVAQTAIQDILDPLDDPTWQIYTPTLGDPVLAATNGQVDVVAGGMDRENDDQLKARMNQRSLDTDRQRGTKAALLTGAMKVPGVLFATPVEPGDGTVIMYVGDPSYQLSAAMAAAVSAEIENWRAFGIPVFVRAYAAQLVQVNLRLFMARPALNYAKALVAAAGQKAVINYFTNLPRPDEYYVDAIVAASFSAHAEVQHAILDTPATSVVRPPDSGYGTVLSLNRYYATTGSVNVQILDPFHS